VFGKIIARDLSLVVSRLYRMAITRAWACHVPHAETLTTRYYIIHLFRSRPPGLQPPVQGKERKQSNKHSAYVFVRSNESRYRLIPHRVTFRRIWRTGKLHLQWQVVKPVPTPFVPGRDPKKRRREEINKKHPKVIRSPYFDFLTRAPTTIVPIACISRPRSLSESSG